MFNVGASKGKGSSDDNDLNWSNTGIETGNTLTLQSGGETTLKGAVAQGKRIIANTGGNLQIESLQDQSTYRSQDKSAGFSLSIVAENHG